MISTFIVSVKLKAIFRAIVIMSKPLIIIKALKYAVLYQKIAIGLYGFSVAGVLLYLILIIDLFWIPGEYLRDFLRRIQN